MTDNQIETEIQAKGLTAPRITPADIEANIASEHYFTAADGARFGWLTADHSDEAQREAVDNIGRAACARSYSATCRDIDANSNGVVIPSLSLLTFCVLVLRNGFTVTGVSYCADPSKFNAETGRVEARKRAIDALWPMVIYAERERLARKAVEQDAA